MTALAQTPVPAGLNWKAAVGVAAAGLLGLGIYWMSTTPRLRTNRRRSRRLAPNRSWKVWVGPVAASDPTVLQQMRTAGLTNVRAGTEHVYFDTNDIMSAHDLAREYPSLSWMLGTRQRYLWQRPTPVRSLQANSLRRDMEELVRLARAQGWDVEKTGSGHWKFKAPTGQIVFAASTPSDWRAIKNAKSWLKRAGLKENRRRPFRRSRGRVKQHSAFLRGYRYARGEGEGGYFSGPNVPKYLHGVAAGRRSIRKNKRAKMSELGVYQAVGVVRSEKPRGQLGFMPPAAVSQLRRSPRGLYKYGWGPKKGWVLTRFKSAGLRGAMTSMRIGAKAVGEFHWLIDNEDPHYPVLVRLVDREGRTRFRVEEYAKERVPVYVERRRSAMR